MKRFMFIWRTENYSYCGYRPKEKLVSPEFIVDIGGKTVWTLSCYPGGYEDENYVGFCLDRCRDDIKPVDWFIKYELSFHAANGTRIKSWVSDIEGIIDGGNSTGNPKFVEREEVLYRRSDIYTTYLTKDTLIARCRIWVSSGGIDESMYINARTHIHIERVAFIETFERFSEMQPCQIKSVPIKTTSEAEESMLMNIFLENDKFFGVRFLIDVERGCDKEIRVATCRIYLLDRFGDATQCGENEFTFHENRSDHWKFPLYPLSKIDLMHKKRDYLPFDRLSLQFQLAFSTGDYSHEIEEPISGSRWMNEWSVREITAGTGSESKHQSVGRNRFLPVLSLFVHR